MYLTIYRRNWERQYQEIPPRLLFLINDFPIKNFFLPTDVFITPKGNSVPIKKILLRSLCQVVETTNLLSFSIDLLILDISDKWNHAMCDLCVWHLSLSMMFARVIHTIICISISFLKKMFLAV